MTEATKHVFSSQALPSKKSRDPGDQFVRLSAKWRRNRGIDDSFDNIIASSRAVMQQFPQLAKAYIDRPTTLSRAPAGADPFKDVELVDEEELS